MLSEEEIQNRVGFHKATIEGPEATLPKHATVREAYTSFMKFLDEVLPEGRHKSLALTELEAASMWSHKAVAAK